MSFNPNHNPFRRTIGRPEELREAHPLPVRAMPSRKQAARRVATRRHTSEIPKAMLPRQRAGQRLGSADRRKVSKSMGRAAFEQWNLTELRNRGPVQTHTQTPTQAQRVQRQRQVQQQSSQGAQRRKKEETRKVLRRKPGFAPVIREPNLAAWRSGAQGRVGQLQSSSATQMPLKGRSQKSHGRMSWSAPSHSRTHSRQDTLDLPTLPSHRHPTPGQTPAQSRAHSECTSDIDTDDSYTKRESRDPIVDPAVQLLLDASEDAPTASPLSICSVHDEDEDLDFVVAEEEEEDGNAMDASPLTVKVQSPSGQLRTPETIRRLQHARSLTALQLGTVRQEVPTSVTPPIRTLRLRSTDDVLNDGSRTATTGATTLAGAATTGAGRTVPIRFSASVPQTPIASLRPRGVLKSRNYRAYSMAQAQSGTPDGVQVGVVATGVRRVLDIASPSPETAPVMRASRSPPVAASPPQAYAHAPQRAIPSPTGAARRRAKQQQIQQQILQRIQQQPVQPENAASRVRRAMPTVDVGLVRRQVSPRNQGVTQKQVQYPQEPQQQQAPVRVLRTNVVVTQLADDVFHIRKPGTNGDVVTIGDTVRAGHFTGMLCYIGTLKRPEDGQLTKQVYMGLHRPENTVYTPVHTFTAVVSSANPPNAISPTPSPVDPLPMADLNHTGGTHQTGHTQQSPQGHVTTHDLVHRLERLEVIVTELVRRMSPTLYQ